MNDLKKIPILTWILWLVSIAVRVAGFGTVAGAFFLLGCIPIYLAQRPAIQKYRKIYDACIIAVAIVSSLTILSLALEALFRNT